jgi:hypothetical protein
VRISRLILLIKYCSGNKKKNEMDGACSLYGVKPKGKRSLGRPRPIWEDNIKMDLQEMVWGMDWIDLAQDRDRWRALVNAVKNLRFS